MGETPRIYGGPGGRLGRAEPSPIDLVEANISPEELARRARDQRRREQVGLENQGFSIGVREDFDWETYAPFVVRVADQTVWTREQGSPPDGYRADTHCVVLPDGGDVGAWFYLTSSRASSPNFPRTVGELEERKARGERRRAERAKQVKSDLAAKRKAARPVLLADLETGTPATLREALEQLDRLGGRVRVDGGRVIVEAPPSELGAWEFGVNPGTKLAAFLYRAEAAILEIMGGKNGAVTAAKAPDRPLLPSGRILP